MQLVVHDKLGGRGSESQSTEFGLLHCDNLEANLKCRRRPTVDERPTAIDAFESREVRLHIPPRDLPQMT